MPKKNVSVIVLALSSPIYIGIYHNNLLIDAITSEEKSSEVLPLLFEDILKKYNVEKLLYANGPGSFMAIKVAYIFLKSLSVLKKIPFLATDAFYFNENRPIKAIGKLYFVKIQEDIKTQKFEIVQEMKFSLPKRLDESKFTNIATPLYKIGAVG
jgi:tRNA A37 threonylcarbamoyladenosine modification protein TsaB